MELKKGFYISRSKKGYFKTNIINGHFETIDATKESTYLLLSELYKLYRKTSFTKEVKELAFDVYKPKLDKAYIKDISSMTTKSSVWSGESIFEAIPIDDITCAGSASDIDDNSVHDKSMSSECYENLITRDDKIDAINKLINFFKEFAFEPNFRFVNTIARQHSYETVCDYVNNYFALTNNSYAQSISEKIKSDEFQLICSTLVNGTTTQINTRFKLYYGSQGTGKTTQAMIEADDNVMVCHSAMLPSDLMEDFNFNDGKAAFTPSALCKAMTEGKEIVLDEINLLPFESLRFLQSILDGKTQFEYKGQTIHIADNFKIIGTMNLQVNGIVYALPEPLVDRAEELKCFKLTADNLINAID